MRPLPNKVTTDVQLARWCRANVRDFKGVYSQSEFPDVYKKMRPGESVIINLDPNYANGGTHWTAARVSSEAPILYYRDSFGAPPPEAVIQAVHDRGVVYENRQVQDIEAENCGRLSAEFLKKMSDAADLGEEIEEFGKISL